ncbi:MAG: M20 metallopeptidase family protein, partial [Nannocystaceae bacterium]
ARVMVAEGALDGVDECYGLHNWPGYPMGQIRVQPGPMMAQVHNFKLTLTGIGGHASQPHLCRDPVVAGAHLVTGLQTAVSRGLGADGGAVLSVSCFHAGDASNIIPEKAHLSGTIRSYFPSATERVLARFHDIIRGTATAHGVKIDLELETGYPVVLNDPNCAETVARVARNLVGPEQVSRDNLPMAGGEDFAYFAQQVPSAYFFIGAQKPGEDTPVCHHPDFDFDDELIPLGVSMFAGILRDRLQA